MYRRCGKRLIDLLVGLVALVLLAPFLLVTMAIVWATIGRPVLFRQQRIGLRNEPFAIWKMRTMTDQTDQEGTLCPDAERVTRITRYIRAMSLDELPNIFNVLGGEMSLVGPRPLVPHDLLLHGAKVTRRHDVRPGITGLSQVSGRSQLPWSKRFELDEWYVDHFTVFLDLVIILRTLGTVFRGGGADWNAQINAADTGKHAPNNRKVAEVLSRHGNGANVFAQIHGEDCETS